MPTYSYQGPRDPKPHVVVADSYERDDANPTYVAFVDVTALDDAPHVVDRMLVQVPGDIEEVGSTT